MKAHLNKSASVKFRFWRREGRLWFASIKDLNQAILSSKYSVFELKRRMGAYYELLLRAKRGEGLSDCEVAQIEYGLAPDSDQKSLIDFFPPSSFWRRFGRQRPQVQLTLMLAKSHV